MLQWLDLTRGRFDAGGTLCGNMPILRRPTNITIQMATSPTTKSEKGQACRELPISTRHFQDVSDHAPFTDGPLPFTEPGSRALAPDKLSCQLRKAGAVRETRCHRATTNRQNLEPSQIPELSHFSLCRYQGLLEQRFF